MLLSLSKLAKKHRMNIEGVIHAGAHLGEEADDYQALGIKNVWWIEANPMVIPKLKEKLDPYGHHLIEALLAEREGEKMLFHITNHNGMSSSVYEFGTHKESSPEMVFRYHRELESRTLDSLAAEYGIYGCNFLNMDLQGSEVPVLRGATHLLKDVDYIYTEVNREEVYIGIELLPEMEKLLAKSGFYRAELSMTDAGWGDALFIKRKT